MISASPTRRRAEEFAAVLDGGAPGGARDADLLAFVNALRETVPVEARADFVADLRASLMAAADTALAPTDARLSLPARTHIRRDRRIALAAGVAVLVGGTSSMAVAAQDALPGDALYPIKRIFESAETSLTVDDSQRATQMLDNAAGRLEEAEALALRNSAESHAALPGTLDDFVDQANDAADILLEEYAETGDAEPIEELRAFTRESLEMLTELSAVLPADLRGLVAWAAEQLTAIEQRAQAVCPLCPGAITELPSSLLAGDALLPATAVAPQPVLEPEKANDAKAPSLDDLVDPLLGEEIKDSETSEGSGDDGDGGAGTSKDPVKDLTEDVLGEEQDPIGGLLDPTIGTVLGPLLEEDLLSP